MKAKTIVDNKFWIVESDEGARVGTIGLTNDGVVISLKNSKERFNTIKDLQKKYNISFNKKFKEFKKTEEQTNEIYGLPTVTKPYNILWQAEMRVPIYTKTKKSNSFHCAGYYIIKFGTGWVKSFCPKLITLQRYPFKGPFKDKLEMLEQLRLQNDSI